MLTTFRYRRYARQATSSHMIRLHSSKYWYNGKIFAKITGKARRLKQAKDEATEEIEKFRQERERSFKEFEAKVSCSL